MSELRRIGRRGGSLFDAVMVSASLEMRMESKLVGLIDGEKHFEARY